MAFFEIQWRASTKKDLRAIPPHEVERHPLERDQNFSWFSTPQDSLQGSQPTALATRRWPTAFAALCPRAHPYRKTKEGQFYYRQKAYLLCDDNQLAAKELLQAYFDRWQIEINHRDEKSILGVGQAQIWADLSAPRVPALMVATYSLMLLSVLETYGPTRTNDYELLPKWRDAARRASCQDAVTLLRKQIEARQGTPTNLVGYPSMVQTAAA